MDTIFIENLTYTGIHGVYKEEHITPQRFAVAVKMEVTTSQSAKTDDLSDTVDYKKIQEAIKDIIEGEHRDLIESLAEDIATTILSYRRVKTCEVTIRKPDAFDVGVPGVRIERKQKEKSLMTVTDTQIDLLTKDIQQKGISVIHLLGEDVRKKCIEEIKNLSLKHAKADVGPYHVSQQFMYSRDIQDDSFLWGLGREIEGIFIPKHVHLFSCSLSFNEISAHVYDLSPVGISFHKDESRFVELIAICVLDGVGDFCIADTREGYNERRISALPGDVIFMKAPGYMGENIRPIHAVKNITKQRISLTFRQEIERS